MCNHIGDNMRGPKNPRWNGGTSEYPNHSQMKRNRLEKLKQAHNKCEVCGGEAFCIHHIDESVDNHDLDNLAILCRKCHSILHAGRQNTSKYTREYGMTLHEMTDKFGGSPGVYYHLHKKGTLHGFIEQQLHEHFPNQENSEIQESEESI